MTSSSRGFRNAMVNVPGHLYQRFLSFIQPDQAEGTFDAAQMQVFPGRGERKSVHAHKDFHDNMPAEAQVGVMYLEGDGKMTFTHDETGEKTEVDVMPGRFISWDNTVYTHTLEAGVLPRRMLGPMTFKDGAFHSVGSPIPILPSDDYYAQAYVSSLLVSAGRFLTVTFDFVLTDWPTGRFDDGRKLILDGVPPPLDELVFTCTAILDGDIIPTSYDKHNSSSSHDDNSMSKSKSFGKGSYDPEDVTVRSSKLTPQTWKPRLTYDVEDDGNTVWTIPEEDTVLDKQYKVTTKYYVGKELESGDEIAFVINFSDLFQEEIVVTVK